MLSTHIAGYALGDFIGEVDWTGSKRKIKYRIDPNASDQWKAWIKEAIDNWNNVKDQTGWEFEEAGEGETADLDFDITDIPASQHAGGASTSGFGGSSLTHLTITIDSDVTDETWPDGTTPSGGNNGWGTEGENTLDPVLVLKHELTHAMRLDHSGGSDTGDLEDPITPGNHNNPVGRRPSTNDTREAKNASDNKTITKKNMEIGPLGGSLIYEGTSIFIEPGVLNATYDFGIRYLSKTWIPNPTYLGGTTPFEDRGVVYARELTTDFPGVFPALINVQMQYSDEDISGGYILGFRHSALFPRLNESTLQAYVYDEMNETWIPIMSTLDMDNNIVFFSAAYLNAYYGVGGMAYDMEPIPPVLVFQVPTTGEVNIPLTFDASGSYDPDGRIVSYKWNFVDGTVQDGDIVEHAFESTGTYNVTLAIIDDDSQASTTDMLVVIDGEMVGGRDTDSGMDMTLVAIVIAFVVMAAIAALIASRARRRTKV